MTIDLRSVLNTEEAVRDVVTQEVMSLEPRAFRAISVDIDSIEIKRESSLPRWTLGTYLREPGVLWNHILWKAQNHNRKLMVQTISCRYCSLWGRGVRNAYA